MRSATATAIVLLFHGCGAPATPAPDAITEAVSDREDETDTGLPDAYPDGFDGGEQSEDVDAEDALQEEESSAEGDNDAPVDSTDCPGRELCTDPGFYFDPGLGRCEPGCWHECANPCPVLLRCLCADVPPYCGDPLHCGCTLERPEFCAFLDPDTDPCNGEEYCREGDYVCDVTAPVVCPDGETCDPATGLCVAP